MRPTPWHFNVVLYATYAAAAAIILLDLFVWRPL
jgi:hypothetical protein